MRSQQPFSRSIYDLCQSLIIFTLTLFSSQNFTTVSITKSSGVDASATGC